MLRQPGGQRHQVLEQRGGPDRARGVLHGHRRRYQRTTASPSRSRWKTTAWASQLEKQHTLFVPFCQPADHKTAKEKGTGLGLVITKAIIECLGGEIDFESTEDKGTKFFFTVEFSVLNKRKHKLGTGGKGADEVRSAPAGKAGDKAGITVSLPKAMSSSIDSSEEEDFIGAADALKEDALPPSARCIIHPRTKDTTRRHVTSILKCFKGRAGVNYVTVTSEKDVEAKVRQAGNLGAPIVLVDVESVEDKKEFITGLHPDAGMILFGLPYQLIELHKRVSSVHNVKTVLKPIKPSDLLDAVNKLVAALESDAKWNADPTPGLDARGRHSPTPMDDSRSSLDATEKLEIASALNCEANRIRTDMYPPAMRASSNSDGSSDGSAARCQRFSSRLERFSSQFPHRPRV